MNSRVVLYLLGALWFIVVILWPIGSDYTTKRVDESQQKAGEDLYKSTLTTANFGLLGARFYESSEGRKHWFIRSRFAELHRKENYAFMRDVNTQFFAEKTGNVIATESEYGRSYMDKSQVELEGNVKVRSKRGYLFTMDKLEYNGKTHEFDTDDMVKMRGPEVAHPTMYLKGIGLHADIDTEHFILRRAVTAQKRLENSEWLHINALSGEFFTDDQRAIFIGKVKSVLPDMNINSDIFEIGNDQVQESLLARGNVVVHTKDRVAHADSAFVEVGTNKIILEGKARVDSKDNQIEGRRIVLYNDSDRVEVDEAEGKAQK